MIVTDFTRQALAYRREIRDMPKAGWEYVGEGGGRLWELYRGHRYTSRIVDVRIAINGKAVWVRIEP